MGADKIALLELDNVRKYFRLRGRSPFSRSRLDVRAVDGVSFRIEPQATFGLVGETGCGKTTTGRLVLKLEEPTSGHIIFQGTDLTLLRGAILRRHRRRIQAVFQDPWSSLNPRMRAQEIIAEPIRENEESTKTDLEGKVAGLLEAVGLKRGDARKFPHEFSGGQRQRIAIARAVGLRPSLIVLDEPVSSLDVSVRAQIMNLLKDLQAEFKMTYLLIAHDLATVRYLCRDIAVMYMGEIVERGRVEEVFDHPLHPYTQALIAADELTVQGADEQKVLSGDVPSPINPPPGCRFHTRCPFAFERCPTEVPRLRELAPGHFAACHLY